MDFELNKSQALEALAQGKKVQHVSFSPEEHVSVGGIGYIFEDGCQCYQSEFWRYRVESTWNNGWRIVND